MVEKELYKLAQELNAISVQSYLKNTGWNRIKSKIDHIAIFTKELNGHFKEILLPLTRNFSDYTPLMLNATKAIAIIENRDYIQVLADLSIATPADVLRIRLVNEDTKEGTISFEDGFKLLENARDALYATACDVIQPETYHRRLSFKAADQFIEKCRLGQTERGSFVASIICPFIEESSVSDKPKQFTLFDDPNEYRSSFTRKITSQIMRSIDVVNRSIESGDLDPIVQGKSDVVMSANFLEAILNIKQLNNDSSSIEFMSTWSPLSPVESNVPSKIEVQKDFVPAIENIIEKMTPKNIEEPGEFVGKVVGVKAEPDITKRFDGEVVLNLMGAGGKSFSARAILHVGAYKEAVEAHEQGKNIQIKGKLITNRKSKVIESPHFKVLD
jgi:hypothetical protein